MDQVGSPRQRLHTLTELSTFLVEHDYDGAHRDAITAAELASHDHDDLYYTEAEIDTALGLKADASALATKVNSSTFTAHTGDTANPHAVTKTQVGLANVDNTSDANKPVSTATQTALDTKAPLAHTHVRADLPDGLMTSISTTPTASRYLGPAMLGGVAISAFTTNTLTQFMTHGVPIFVPWDCTLISIEINITSAVAASTLRMGVFSVAATGFADIQLLDAGTASAAATGVVAITGLSLTLTGGTWIYYGVVPSAAGVIVTAFNSPYSPFQPSTFTTTQAGISNGVNSAAQGSAVLAAPVATFTSAAPLIRGKVS